MFNWGDWEVGDVIRFFFDTYGASNESITITGLAVTDIEVYKDGSVTQRASDNGFALLDTDGIDFDGATGLHGFSIDTGDNSDSGFWSAGGQYVVNINAITVNSQTVRLSFHFTLGRLLKPTTAGRKLDVSSGGEAGIDWANIGSPTTTVNLSGTTTKEVTDVQTKLGTPAGASVSADVAAVKAQTSALEVDTQDIQGRLPAALTADGNMKADALRISGSDTTADGIEAIITGVGGVDIKIGQVWIDSSDALGSLYITNDTGPAVYVHETGGAGVAVYIQSATGIGIMSLGATYGILASPENILTLDSTTLAQIADALLDEPTAGHTTAGTLGKAVIDTLADTNELQQDWTNGGRLDLLLDTVVTATGAAAIRTAVGLAAANLDTQLSGLPAGVWAAGTRTLTAFSFEVGLAASEDVYHAEIDLIRDEANTQDEYTVTWFKNGVRVTSGITSPLIQVVKRADGTDLVASTALTQIGATGSYKYDEDTNRLTAGEAALVVVSATIDASGRTFSALVGRDSTA